MSYKGAAIFTIGVCALALSLLLPVDVIVLPLVRGENTIAIGGLITFGVGLAASLIVIRWGCNLLQVSFKRGISLACFVSILFSLVVLTGDNKIPIIIQDILNAVIGGLLYLSPTLTPKILYEKPKKVRVKMQQNYTKSKTHISNSPPIVGKCAVCGKRIYLPYRCNYCGGLFCDDHILPPKHNCPEIERWRAADRLPTGVTWEHKGAKTYYRKY